MVSIIIPCYNVAHVVERTLDSVLKQNDGNWEIIVIDDGSSDSTLALLEQYSQKDKRIRVYHQENKGVSAARNEGLKHVRGEWIYFLDGDDEISSSLIESIDSQSKQVDVYVFGFQEVRTKKTIRHPLRNTKKLLENFLLAKTHIHISSMAFNTNLVKTNTLAFDEDTAYGEDREFLAKSLTLAKYISTSEEMFFSYIEREGSAMKSREYKSAKFSSVLACERIYKMLCGTPAEKAAFNHLIFTLIRHIKLYLVSETKEERLGDKLSEYKKKYMGKLQYLGVSKMGLYNTFITLVSKNDTLFNFFLKLY